MTVQQLPNAFDKIDVSAIQKPKLVNNGYLKDLIGTYVAVRPAGEGQRTYLGLYLGEMCITIGCSFEGAVLELTPQLPNPVIFVPEMKQIIYGMESWWGAIESPEHLKDITNADINNVWYVQALKALYPDITVPGSETVN